MAENSSFFRVANRTRFVLSIRFGVVLFFVDSVQKNFYFLINFFLAGRGRRGDKEKLHLIYIRGKFFSKKIKKYLDLIM